MFQYPQTKVQFKIFKHYDDSVSKHHTMKTYGRCKREASGTDDLHAKCEWICIQQNVRWPPKTDL